MSSPIRAAGGVVRRRGEVLLVHRPKYGDWTFPKGKAEPGESDEDCALREVEEETGLRCELGRPLATTRYRTLNGAKVVRYWEMTPLDGRFDPSREIDQIRWVLPRLATTLLSYGHDRAVLDALGAAPLLVIRHASAGDRDEWRGDDQDRPLDAKGRRQAADLVPLLEPYAVDAVVSSPFKRCVETVEPIAAARGIAVETSGELAEGAGPERTRRLLESLAGSAAVVCGHGSEIEPLFGKTKKAAVRTVDGDLRVLAVSRP